MADAVSELLGQELPASQREQIIGIARGHSQVRGVERVDFIELHLELDDHMPLIVAHEVSDAVQEAIMAAITQADLMIHLDPVGFAEEQLDDRIEAAENAEKEPLSDNCSSWRGHGAQSPVSKIPDAHCGQRWHRELHDWRVCE